MSKEIIVSVVAALLCCISYFIGYFMGRGQ